MEKGRMGMTGIMGMDLIPACLDLKALSPILLYLHTPLRRCRYLGCSEWSLNGSRRAHHLQNQFVERDLGRSLRAADAVGAAVLLNGPEEVLEDAAVLP